MLIQLHQAEEEVMETMGVTEDLGQTEKESALEVRFTVKHILLILKLDQAEETDILPVLIQLKDMEATAVPGYFYKLRKLYLKVTL